MPEIKVKKIRGATTVSLDDGPMTIGRSSENALVLPDKTVSRRHCIIESVDGRPRLRDLGSRYGTRVNGLEVSEAPLCDGDAIAVGPFEVVFVDPKVPHPVPAATAPPLHADAEPLSLVDDDADPDLARSADALVAPLAPVSGDDADDAVRRLQSRQAALEAREAMVAEAEERIAAAEAALAERASTADRRDDGAEDEPTTELDAGALETLESLEDQRQELARREAAVTRIEQTLAAQRRALDIEQEKLAAQRTDHDAPGGADTVQQEREAALDARRAAIEEAERDLERRERGAAETAAELETRAHSIQAEREAWTAERGQLQADLETRRTELEAELDTRRTELDADFEQRRTGLEAEVEQRRTELEDDLRMQHTELEERRARADQEHAELARLREELTTRQRDLEAQLEACARTRDEQSAGAESLAREQALVKAERERLEQARRDAAEADRQRAEELDRLTADAYAERDELARQREVDEAARAALEEDRQRLTDERQSLEQAQAAHEAARADAAREAAVQGDLREKLAAIETQLVGTQRELVTDRGRCRELESQLAEARGQAVETRRTLRKELKELETRHRQATERITSLEQLLGQLALGAGQLHDASQQLTSVRQNVARLETLWIETNEWLDDAEQDDPEFVEQARRQRDGVAEQLEAAQSEKETMTSELQSMLVQFTRLAGSAGPAEPASGPPSGRARGRMSGLFPRAKTD